MRFGLHVFSRREFLGDPKRLRTDTSIDRELSNEVVAMSDLPQLDPHTVNVAVIVTTYTEERLETLRKCLHGILDNTRRAGYRHVSHPKFGEITRLIFIGEFEKSCPLRCFLIELR